MPLYDEPAAPTGEAGRSLLCQALVQRQQELARLVETVERLPGTGAFVVVSGEAGVGKTRLVRECAADARARGVPVLVGRCVPGPTPSPYRPLTEALLAAFRDAPPPAAARLSGFGGQVARLVPSWGVAAAGGADESPVLLGEAVLRLLQAVGERGRLLVVEDAQWADAETVAVLEYLAGTVQDCGVVCLTTTRPDAAADLLSRLRRQGPVVAVDVPPLTGDGVREAVASCLGVSDPPTDLVDCVATNSEGNPFLVEELLAGLAAAGALRQQAGGWVVAGRLVPRAPFLFADAVNRRLQALDGAARRVLRAAALLGRRFDWELLPALAEVDGRAVIEALRSAVREQLIVADAEVFRFRHALTRELVLGELLGPERRELARRALPAVERAHPGLPDGWCELAADLAQEAGDGPAAVRLLGESARRSLRRGALASAESAARRARTLAAGEQQLADVDILLVEVLSAAGKADDALVAGEDLVRRLDDGSRTPAEVGHVLLLLARAAVDHGDAERADALVARAQRLTAGGAAATARWNAIAAHVALAQDRTELAVRRARAAVRGAADTGQPAVECEALEVLGRAHRHRSDSARWFHRAADLAERHGLATWEVRARHEAALLAAYLHGDLRPLHEVRELAHRRGSLVSVAVMDLTLAEVCLSDFDQAGCLAAAGRCVAASARYGLATLPVAHLWLAGGYALAADRAAMEQAISEALRSDPEDPRILGDVWGRVRAVSAMVRDDRAELTTALDTMMTYARVAPTSTSIFPTRILWAVLHAGVADDGAAAVAELQAATYLRVWPLFPVALDTAEAVLLGRAGRSAEATARFPSAQRWAALSRAGEGLVRYLQLLAAEPAIRDGWGEPARWLRQAEAYFGARGFSSIVRRCHTLLAAAGAPVPRQRTSGVPERLRAMGITRRECDVLALVAQGLSNRQIAAELFLSVKTVERHVGSLYERSGQRGRAALRALWAP